MHALYSLDEVSTFHTFQIQQLIFYKILKIATFDHLFLYQW